MLRICFLICLISCLISFSNLQGQGLDIPDPVSVEITTPQSKQHLPKPLWMIKEGRSPLNINDIVNKDLKDGQVIKFNPGDAVIEPLGKYWFAIAFSGDVSLENWLLHIEPTFNGFGFSGSFSEIDAYTIVDGQVIATGKTGYFIPRSKRDFQDRHTQSLLKVNHVPGSTTVFWVHIKRNQTLKDTFPDLTLYQYTVVLPEFLLNQRDLFWFGNFLVIWILSLILYLYLRDRTSVWFLIYMTIVLLDNLTIWASDPLTGLLYPEHPKLGLYFGLFTSVMMVASLLQFTRVFIDLPAKNPKMNRLVIAASLILLLLGNILVVFIEADHRYFLHIYMSFYYFSITLTGILYLSLKDTLAKIFGLAILLFIGPQLLPLPFDHNHLSISALLFTVTIGVGYRIKMLFKERLKAEKEKKDLLLNQNTLLEKQVEERTAELIDKNHELSVEAGLEKIRTVAIGIKNPQDILEVCRTIAGQLKELGVTNIRNVQIAIIDEKIGQYICYQYFPAYDQTIIEDTAYHKSPIELEMVRQMLSSKDGYFTGSLQGLELEEFRAHRKEEKYFPDPLYDQVTALGYCFLSIGEGGLGLSLYKDINTEEVTLFKRFHQVFSLAFQRFQEIIKAQAQARETQIQLSLERIRAKAMAMQHSDELSDFLTVLFEQFDVLNLDPVNCHLHFFDIENNRSTFRLTGKKGATLIATQEFDLLASPAWDHKVQDLKSGHPKEVDSIFIPCEDISEIGEIFKEILEKLPEEERPLPEDYPNGEYITEGYCKFGYLGYSASRLPSEEEKEITRRIANEFGNVYQRFLDLQKAEAQAREAQIQLSLERIRAKAMAMQHSDELSEFLTVVFEQFEILNLNPVFCHLSFFDTDNNKFVYRMTGKKGSSIIATQDIDLDATPLWRQNIEDWKSGHPYQVGGLYIPRENMPEMAEIFKEILGKLPEEERPLVEDFPNGQYVVDAYCKYGYLGYSASGPPSDEEKDITRRIATEFGNVYQRFLDLEKAEFQAREAQIQLSLERIRAKAMAMQHTYELSDFLTVVFEQFEVLNLRPINCQLSLLDIENNRSIFRMTGKKGATLIATQEVDLDASPIWKQQIEEWKSGNPKDVEVLYVPFDQLPEIAEIFKEIMDKLPEDILPQLEDYPNGQYVIEGNCKYGYLGYSASGPPTDEEKEITRRIATEFGNVYQRFLDLQKAEDQGREAEIQLALERVRARSLAMHRSEELADLSLELVKQVQVLGMESWFCAFNIYDDDPRGSVEWGSNGRGTFPKYRTPREGVFLQYYEAGQRGETFLVNEIGEEECPAHYEYLCSLPGVGEQLLQMKNSGIPFPTSQIDHVAYFKYGYVLFITYEPAPEFHDIFKRFANVFEQSYTRFLDLQKAEAQAREAQIEAALERVRSRSLAMHRSDELEQVAASLFEAIVGLGITMDGALLFVFDRKTRNITLWVTIVQLTNPVLIELPYEEEMKDNEIILDYWKATDQGQMLSKVYTGEAKNEYFRYVQRHNSSKISDQTKNHLIDLPSWHLSFAAEKNTMLGLDSWSGHLFTESDLNTLRKFARAFEQAYVRFLDLQKAEAQAREAQIEAALERVRSRTMAMQHSDELTEVASLLFNQVSALGIKTWTAGFNVWSEDNNSCVDYISVNGQFIEPYTVHTEKAEALKDVSNARKSGEEFVVLFTEGEKIKQLYQAISGIDEKQYEILLKDGLVLSQQYEHFVFGSKVSLMFLTYEPVPEAHDIFKRLGKVFEQTYTRFLDLQKAEAQVREAQIEAALERVRSRTMAMQQSDELTDVASLLFKQVSALGIRTWTTGFNVWSEDNNSYVDYLSLNGEIFGPNTVLTEKAEALIDLSNARKSGVEFDILYVEGEKIRQLYLALSGIDEKEYDIMVKDGLLPSHQYEHFVFGAKVSVMFITYEPVPEAHDIFKRLGKVFEQTYTRFLDLKKAEAQARESEIEVALEKVRSHSLAMHKSDDLKDVVFSVFERLRELQIQTDSTSIAVYHDDSAIMELWAANDMNYASKFSIPMTGRFYPLEGMKARKEQKAFVQHLSFEEKNRYWKELFDTPDFQKVPEARKNYLLEKTECLIQLITFGKVTGTLLIRHFNNPFSVADIEIAERFAKVFDQAYTRFLDLKKAEGQAREAQIENALEKVRSRSLAMQSPDELIDVAHLLREEMGALGVEELETSSIYIQEENSGLMQCWFTIKDTDDPTKTVTDLMVMDLNETWVGRQMKEFFHSASEKTSILMQGKNRLEWIQYCESKTKLFGASNFYGDSIPDRIYHLYKFSNGYIGASAPGNISTESWELLKRATGVFSFAYTRFRDLQKAQASAIDAMRQASLDRIRADISSMRHANDLDRITPLMFKELTVLGVPFIRCGVFIIQEKQEIVEAYLSSPEGSSLGVLRLPFQASELTYQTVKAWRKGEIYRQHWNKEDFIQWITQLMEQDQIQDSSTYQGAAVPPESLDLHFVPFAQGMLYVGAKKLLNENELELVQELAKVFSIAYARYEDFVKLEIAKVEVESAMSELKSTQSQLIQQEKLASLGQLTAGIAHEIKNPLNFVNNFSEVSLELIEEAIEERNKSAETRDDQVVDEILSDIKSNIEKVYQHGTRANGIVTSMLQHSRGGSGKKEPTDLNALIKEYVNLSYHGMRARKNPIDVEIMLELDAGIQQVTLNKEDFSRVLINLCNNAFDACAELSRNTLQQKSTLGEIGNAYHPKLAVRTKTVKDHILIEIEDNGPGIPEEIKDKILQPFFTTKKGTEGTGLGLSITHDIIKAHGGSISIASDGKGSTFTIILPNLTS
jgi:signal transduction histidine kinase